MALMSSVALVFMVVGLHFFIKTLTPDTQKVFAAACLGDTTWVRYWKYCVWQCIGASQDMFYPTIYRGKVFVMMDPCDMLKLARNMLQTHSFCSNLFCWNSEMELYIRAKWFTGRRGSTCCQQDQKKAHTLQHSEDESVPGCTDILWERLCTYLRKLGVHSSRIVL